jgi:hypothetical protein
MRNLETIGGKVRLTLGILSGLSAASELFGTWTVWVNYHRTSHAADLVVAEMARAKDLEDEYLADPNNRTLDFLSFKRDVQAERNEKNFVRSAFTNAMSPLRPNRVTKFGLLAYVLGAILGLVAALIALS